MNISEKILKLRTEAGLSQEALAEKLGVSRQSVSKWESGAALPDTDKIIAMSDLFKVSTDYLLKADTEVTAPAVEDVPAAAYSAAQPQPVKSGKKKKPVAKIIALVLVVCIVACGIGVPAYFGGVREAWWALNGGKIQYSYVLVHGLGGWGEGGEGINDISSYWGASTGNLVEYLNSQGHKVYAPSVGPVSSAWDRACELYAQLTGTTVDYGEAHSKEHNHARYGRTYDTPLIEGWGTKVNGGQRVKINLIGHSFGGATVRLLTSLLEYGSEAETSAANTEGEVSPLFEGGKGNWINSVTALCAPHNGSSLTEVLNSVGGIVGIKDTTDMLINLCFGVAGITSPSGDFYDFKLDHFGFASGGYKEAVAAVTASGNDHAGYDLSPDGAAKLNEQIKLVEGVYYFSYSYSTTKDGTLLKGQVPVSTTLPVLYPFALAMGSFKGTTANGISIDETWQENDGLVSVVSARYPTNDAFIDLTEDPKNAPETWEEIETGIWYVAPTKDGDHGTVIGLNAHSDTTQKFYVDLFTMVDALER